MAQAYFVAGASGSGKSAIMQDLKKLLGNEYSVFDFDDIGVPDNADTAWRQQATEQWIEKILNEKKDTVLLGQMVLGEILACPSAQKLGKVNFCLLEVDDFERVERLKKRNTYGDQGTLNWASWLRVHHKNPQWEQRVIKNNSWQGLIFTKWDTQNTWDELANITVFDTTGRKIFEVALAVKQWML